MKSQNNVLVELCNVALTASLHADALECAIDDAQNTLTSMEHQEDALLKLEEELHRLIKRKAKIDSLRSLVHRTRNERENSLASVYQLQRRQRQLEQEQEKQKEYMFRNRKRFDIQITNKTHHVDVNKDYNYNNNNNKNTYNKYKNNCYELTSSSASASQLQEELEHYYKEEEEEEQEPEWVEPSQCEEDNLSVNTQAASAIDNLISKVQTSIATLHDSSIKTKLLKLEEVKRRVHDSHSIERVTALLDNYTLPACVEKLWNDSNNNNNKNVITKHNLGNLLKKAADHYTTRYASALHALSHANLTTQSDWKEVLENMIYAQELDVDNPNRLCDLNLVSYLQEHYAHAETSAGNATLRKGVDNYNNSKGKKSSSGVYEKEVKKCTPSLLLSSSSSVSSPSNVKQSIVSNKPLLSRFDFCALPSSWPEAQELTHIPQHSVLPPARHILTERFSYANLDELIALQRLRVEVQRLAVQRVLGNLQSLIPATLSHYTSRQRAVASIRIATLTNSISREFELLRYENNKDKNNNSSTKKKEKSDETIMEQKAAFDDSSKLTKCRSNAWLTFVEKDAA